MQLALSSKALLSMPRSRALPRTTWPTASAACTGVATVNVNGALRRELSVLLHAREAARVQRSRSPRS
jgi:hypothetical protein